MYKLTSLLLIFGLNQQVMATQQCPDINVISTQGKYLVLDSKTLITKDVGDLRAAGIYELNVLGNNSSVDNFVISVDYIYNLKKKQRNYTRSSYLLPSHWQDVFNQNDLFQLTMFRDMRYTRINETNLYVSIYSKDDATNVSLFDGNSKKTKIIN